LLYAVTIDDGLKSSLFYDRLVYEIMSNLNDNQINDMIQYCKDIQTYRNSNQIDLGALDYHEKVQFPNNSIVSNVDITIDFSQFTNNELESLIYILQNSKFSGCKKNFTYNTILLFTLALIVVSANDT